MGIFQRQLITNIACIEHWYVLMGIELGLLEGFSENGWSYGSADPSSIDFRSLIVRESTDD